MLIYKGLYWGLKKKEKLRKSIPNLRYSHDTGSSVSEGCGCVRACVCVREREREEKMKRDDGTWKHFNQGEKMTTSRSCWEAMTRVPCMEASADTGGEIPVI
jgi:hypothetical protein